MNKFFFLKTMVDDLGHFSQYSQARDLSLGWELPTRKMAAPTHRVGYDPPSVDRGGDQVLNRSTK
jgi:hypothetical protein